tara:strand:- start:2064 stop:2990 length:927 start_codon:yes stop_codon:yes gene_type:complete
MSFFKLKFQIANSLFIPLYALFVLLGISGCNQETKDSQSSLESEIIKTIEDVAALGQLSPMGEVRTLASPMSGFGGTPRVAELLIKEGDFVKKGQVLVVFDNQARLIADIEKVEAKFQTIKERISKQKQEIFRYKEPSIQGAYPLVLFEEKQDELLDLEGQKKEVLADLKGLEADFSDSQLVSPIDGLILRLHTLVGEREGSDGILDVGAVQSMEALVEVYESDISRIKIGQSVSLISENGGFKGTLHGTVLRISPQVSQRKVLSTDPTGDADARVVEVQVQLDNASSESVQRLTGMKVIAKFTSSSK